MVKRLTQAEIFRQIFCLFPPHFKKQVFFYPEKCVQRNTPYMRFTILIIADVFQGCFYRNLRVISAAEQMKALSFRVVR